MISLERFEEVMADLVDELPEELFYELNRGVIISTKAKRHPQGVPGDLYILGEYESGGMLGQAVILYYRSFGFVFGDCSEEEIINEMRITLRHELRHHWEYLSGERDLELEDERWLAEYMAELEEERGNGQ